MILSQQINNRMDLYSNEVVVKDLSIQFSAGFCLKLNKTRLLILYTWCRLIDDVSLVYNSMLNDQINIFS